MNAALPRRALWCFDNISRSSCESLRFTQGRFSLQHRSAAVLPPTRHRYFSSASKSQSAAETNAKKQWRLGTSSRRYASTVSATASRPTVNASTPSNAPASATQSSSSPYGRAATKSGTVNNKTGQSNSPPISDLSLGLADSPIPSADTDLTLPFLQPSPNAQPVDWARSFHGLSTVPFSEEAQRILQEPIKEADIEIKPDGLAYLPEIKYRRILNRAFGPGAWGLAPRGETLVTGKSVTREYGLVVHGRLVSIARGEQQYFDPEGIPTATEGCKSNALMRCCKDLGIASELWDPVFIRKFMAGHSREVWVEHVSTKKKRKITVKKGIPGGVAYPYKEVKGP